jgi:hypothetical protein
VELLESFGIVCAEDDHGAWLGTSKQLNRQEREGRQGNPEPVHFACWRPLRLPGSMVQVPSFDRDYLHRTCRRVV